MQYRPTNISIGFDKFSIARLAYNAGVHDVPRCPRYNRLLLYFKSKHDKVLTDCHTDLEFQRISLVKLF
jgi:hypothetical protein